MTKSRAGVVVLLWIFLPFVATCNLAIVSGAQWIILARSFIAGKPYLIQPPAFITDSVLLNGHYYWPFGPFPALLLVPFVAVADFLRLPFTQGYLQCLLIVAVFYLVYRLARKFFSVDDSLYFSIAFTFASAFLWVAVKPGEWTYLPYIVVDAALFAALLEYTGKKRWWLIGILMSAVLATRPTAAIGILFFLGDIFLIAKMQWRQKMKSAIILLLPFVITGILLAGYNYVRFGNFFESGYGLQIVTNPLIIANRNYGLFSPVHVPGNLYYFLLATPVPVFRDAVSHVLQFPYIKMDPWGMGIFFVSPYLLSLFLLSYRDKTSRLLLLTSLAILIPILFYFGIGYHQLGYRYSLDFMPFIYFLWMRNWHDHKGALSRRMKLLIFCSALLDLYFVFTFFLLPS